MVVYCLTMWDSLSRRSSENPYHMKDWNKVDFNQGWAGWDVDMLDFEFFI